MPSSLTRPDFLRLLEIVESHPEFRTEPGRWHLVDRAFRGIERGSAARRGLNLAGATGQAATALVTRLDSFGRLGDRHSLALVLEVIRADSSADLHPDLDRLIAVLDGQHTTTPNQRTGTILHLSDLHFGTPADARNWHSQLAEDLRRELDCDRLDGLICSGDLATFSTAADYAAAVAFLTYPEQFSFHHWADLDLLVLGLNSAWAIDHHHRDRAGIHPEAISQALDQLHTRPDWAGCLKIAVWHHPLNSGEPSRITDHGFVERLALAGFRLGLHGHIHRAERDQYRYDQSPGGRRLDLLAAGTFGALSRDWVPGYPLQYQLLRLTPAGAGRRLTVATRRRAAPNGAWQPDACWFQGPGQDPLPRYTVDL